VPLCHTRLAKDPDGHLVKHPNPVHHFLTSVEKQQLEIK